MTGWPLILVSAWNDSGGAFLHRLLDGHPELRAYPFELQLGTGLTTDGFSDWFKAKYRWPAWPWPLEEATQDAIFDSIIDDELKSAVSDSGEAKFREFRPDISETAWRAAFKRRLVGVRVTRRRIVDAYIAAVFDVWRDRHAGAHERFVVGHCPVVNLDHHEICNDKPDTRFLHVLRDPLSGLADMRARRPEVDAAAFARKWSLVNAHAALLAGKYPSRFRIVRVQDLVETREATMDAVCDWLGIERSQTVYHPTWNGARLNALYPFGGLRSTEPGYAAQAAARLSDEDRREVTAGTAAVAGLLPPLPNLASDPAVW